MDAFEPGQGSLKNNVVDNAIDCSHRGLVGAGLTSEVDASEHPFIGQHRGATNKGQPQKQQGSRSLTFGSCALQALGPEHLICYLKGAEAWQAYCTEKADLTLGLR
jgi:hypothetical protein